MSTSLTVNEGDDIQVACNANGNPEPNISWYLAKTKLKKNTFLKGMTFKYYILEFMTNQENF